MNRRALPLILKYAVNGNSCDECGSCYTVCPANAVKAKTPREEADRRECRRKTLAYVRAQKDKN